MDPTLVRHLDDYELWQRSRRLNSVTIRERRRVLEQFFKEVGVQPSEASAREVMLWLDAHPRWSQATHCTYWAYLNSWFKYLQMDDVRADNPMLRIGSPKLPDRLPRPVSSVDVRLMLSGPSYKRTHAMIALAAFQGLRVHEIAKFRGEDIDLASRTITVRGKAGSNCALPLHPFVEELAAEMPAKSWWFPAPATRPGEHVRGKSVSQTISDYMKRCNVPGTPHALRHFFATQLVSKGVDLVTVRDLMRHKNVQTTTIYTKLPNSARTEALRKVDPWT